MFRKIFFFFVLLFFFPLAVLLLVCLLESLLVFLVPGDENMRAFDKFLFSHWLKIGSKKEKKKKNKKKTYDTHPVTWKNNDKCKFHQSVNTS